MGIISKIKRKVRCIISKTDSIENSTPKPYSGMWSGNYNCWNDVIELSQGYNSNEIVEQCKQALLEVVNGRACYERDSALFHEPTYNFPIVSYIFHTAVTYNKPINLIDFGGSLGSTYFQNKGFLPANIQLTWKVVEQQIFTQCGKEYFADKHLKFYNTIREADAQNDTDIILLSSVLQYIENPEVIVSEVLKTNAKYIILDRTAIAKSENHIITLQKVPEDIYSASYPAWFFNKEKLIAMFTTDYMIDSQFDVTVDKPITLEHNIECYWTGIVFKRKG